MRVLLQENDKLLGLVEEKSRELKEYQEIERKIHVIIAENTRLNEVLAEKERENNGSSLVMHQNQTIDKQNEQIEQLVRQLEDMRGVEEENQNMRAREGELQMRIQEISRESQTIYGRLNEKEREVQEVYLKNQEIWGKFEDGERKIQELEQEMGEKSGKLRTCEQNVQALLQENERFRGFFEEKKEENRQKLGVLVETNDHLNSVVETLMDENQRLSVEKSTETLQKDEYYGKFVSLLTLNEQIHEALKVELLDKEQNSIIHSKIEQLIENNQALEQAYHEKEEESAKYKTLIDEYREKETKDFEGFRAKATAEEIEKLMVQIEILKSENAELLGKNNELERAQAENQDFEGNLADLIEENRKLSEFNSRSHEEFEEKERELVARIQDLEAENNNYSEIKSELERLLNEKEEFSGNLHEKCVLLLEENNKLQQIIENKDQETNGLQVRIGQLEEDIEEKLTALRDYELKNENICQEFAVLKQEFESHRLNNKSEENNNNDNFEETLIKLQKELEILKGQNNHWKIMNETRDKEILKLYDLLKARKQENLGLLRENQEIKEQLKGLALNGGHEFEEGEKEENERLRLEVDGLKQELENSLISLEYYKGEYENTVKLMEEVKGAEIN